MKTIQSRYQGIISLWAVAECGLGGVMHALKIPFTGIFVGSISVMCLFFIAKYSDNKRQSIIEATLIVLVIKLMASPQSPWQAYVAVTFQALCALLLLTGKNITNTSILLFALITQLESSVQRVLIMILVFGSSFFEAIDKSISQLVKYLGIDYSGTVVMPVFIIYISLHFITGIVLGIWIPRLERNMEYLKSINIELPKNSEQKAKMKKSKLWLFIGIAFLLPLALSWYLDDKSLFYVFFRVLLLTLLFVFVITPVVKALIKRVASSREIDHQAENILNQLPQLLLHYSRYLNWAWNHFKGIKKFKYSLVALLYASIHDYEIK